MCPVSESVHSRSNADIDTITLMLTTHCNLSCPYCFAGGGSYNSEAMNMPVGTALRSLDILMESLPGVKVVKLFGGEPLCNTEALAAVCEYARDKSRRHVLMGLSTNGTLLTPDVVDLLVEHHVATSISIDGPREITNLLRKDHGGRGYFDEVMAGIGHMQAKTDNFAIEATYTGLHMRNEISLVELVKYLNGFSRTVKVQPVMMPASSELAIEDFKLFREHIAEYSEAIFRALCSPKYFEDKYIYENFAIRCLANIMLGSSAPETICQIGRNITVFPNGDLCPCYLFRDSYMGNIYSDPVPNPTFNTVRQGVLSEASARSLEGLGDHGFWYRQLVGDICLGELAHPAGDPTELTPISQHLELFYDSIARDSLARYASTDPESSEGLWLRRNLEQLHSNLCRWMTPND